MTIEATQAMYDEIAAIIADVENGRDECRSAGVSCKMLSSAKLCLSDARDCLDKGDMVYASRRLLRSLEYAVGIYDPVYRFWHAKVS